MSAGRDVQVVRVRRRLDIAGGLAAGVGIVEFVVRASTSTPAGKGTLSKPSEIAGRENSGAPVRRSVSVIGFHQLLIGRSHQPRGRFRRASSPLAAIPPCAEGPTRGSSIRARTA